MTTPANNPPTISITSPASGAVINAPASVTINASAADSDGTVSKVDFYDGATLLGTVNGGTAKLNATWPYNSVPVGAHTLKATATDNAGATTSATVTITVNTPPLVVLTQPLACLSLQAPANVVLTADAVDPDGWVARVDFYEGTNLIGTATAAPYTADWTNVASGSYSLTARQPTTWGPRPRPARSRSTFRRLTVLRPLPSQHRWKARSSQRVRMYF